MLRGELTGDYLVKRLNIARNDRSVNTRIFDEVMHYSRPDSPSFQYAPTATDSERSLGDVFDVTLRESVDDFGADMSNLFTPRHEEWVRLQPDAELSDGEKRELSPQIDILKARMFSAIEKSNYYVASSHAWKDLAVSCMGISIELIGLNDIRCEHIEVSSMLLGRGPNGEISERFREWPDMAAEDLLIVFAGRVTEVPTKNKGRTVRPIDGWVRDYSDPLKEVWWNVILLENEILYKRKHEGAGSCGFIICRWSPSKRTSWLYGPAVKALPPQRTLNELGFQKLNALNRTIDPPMSYEEDGVINVENGIDAGRWVPRAVGSRPPEPLFDTTNFNMAVFETERLVLQIKKALYQDRPDQSGKTPPTATQWLDEKAWNTRRMELPREQINAEWVMPVLNRFIYLLNQSGQFEELNLDGSLIKVEPVTPLTKSRDLDKLNITQQTLSIIGLVAQMGQAIPSIDAGATIDRIKATANEQHIVVKSAEQMAQEQQMAQMMQMMQQQQGQPSAEEAMV